MGAGWAAVYPMGCAELLQGGVSHSGLPSLVMQSCPCSVFPEGNRADTAHGSMLEVTGQSIEEAWLGLADGHDHVEGTLICGF